MPSSQFHFKAVRQKFNIIFLTYLTLKKEAKQKIDQLSDDKLKVAFDFLSYLEEKEEWEATEELSQIPNLLEEYRQAKSKIKAGQTIKWSEIRRDV